MPDNLSKPRARLIAFYLPQFHPIPENDEWWGPGFTEWTNTAKARPMFRGHYQPHIPADLGYYDLRLAETRQEQADMAAEYGIEAFCYYHYWFSGRRILERPFQEVLDSGQPDFPFCVCWANETWQGIWHGSPKRVLIEQTYPGEDDYRAHFETLLPAFADPRHVRIDGKPIFIIYRGWEIPEIARVTDLWREMAVKAGLPGLYMAAVQSTNWTWSAHVANFDAVIPVRVPPKRPWISWRHPWRRLSREAAKLRNRPTVYNYEDVLDKLIIEASSEIPEFPCLVSNWDNTPRSGRDGLVLHGSTPALFERHFECALSVTENIAPERNLIFIKSWNEWAEGNHLEPDLRFGRRYLDVIRKLNAG